MIPLVVVFVVSCVLLSGCGTAASDNSKPPHQQPSSWTADGKILSPFNNSPYASDKKSSPSLESVFSAVNFTGVARISNDSATTAWEGLFGFADSHQSRRMTSNTRFPIGSNTKFMIAIAIYQLQEAGKLNVTDSIANYLNQSDFAAMGYEAMTSYCPKLPGNASCQTITFEQLLDMTSGIMVNALEEFLPFPGTTALTVGSSIVDDLLFIPGTQYYYSNPSFNLAGYFVEKLSGQKLAAYLKEHIFDVLGMSDTYLDVHNGQLAMDVQRTGEFRQFISNQSDASLLLGLGTCRTELDLGSVSGAGGVVSTVEDERTLWYAFFNATAMGLPLLSKRSSWQAIMKPRTLVSATSRFYYAQGIGVYSDDGETVQYVAYMGGLMCVQTANFMDLTVYPPRMSQAFSNSVVYTSSPDWFSYVQSLPFGALFSILNTMQVATTPFVLVQQAYFSMFPQQ